MLSCKKEKNLQGSNQLKQHSEPTTPSYSLHQQTRSSQSNVPGPGNHNLRPQRTAPRLRILIAVTLVGMPNTRHRAETLPVFPRFLSVRGEVLQSHLLVFLVSTAGATLVATTRSLGVGPVLTGECRAHAREVAGAEEAAGREDFAEQRSEDRAAGGSDGEAGLAAGPDGDVGGGVEEVVYVAEGVDVGDADDCCN